MSGYGRRDEQVLARVTPRTARETAAAAYIRRTCPGDAGLLLQALGLTPTPVPNARYANGNRRPAYTEKRHAA